MASSSYRSDIDGLRAVAVSLVILYHFNLGPFDGGFVGVDIFFVISGFLITGLILKEIAEERFHFRHFWLRRARRILPASLVMMTVVSVVFAFVYPPHLFEEVGRALFAQVLFSSNILFWQETSYFSTAAKLKPLLHMWSLAVEEQFYFLFPIALLLISRYSRSYIFWIVLSGCLLSLFGCIVLTTRDPAATFFLLPTRSWELGTGALLAVVISRLRTIPLVLASLLSFCGLVLVIASALIYDANTPYPSYRAIMPVVGAVLLIWGNTYTNNPVRKLFSVRPLVWIGLLSYSLYLWHWPIAVLFEWFSLKMGESWHSSAALGIVILIAIISWRFVEQPIRHNRNVFTDRRLVIGSSFAALTALTLGVAAVIIGNSFVIDADHSIEKFRSTATYTDKWRLDCTDLIKRGTGEVSCKRSYRDDDSGSVDVFLWGDSHAAALLPGFDEASQQLGYNLEFSITNGCQAVVGMRRSDADVGCKATSEAVMQHIIKSRFPVVVLVSSYVNNVIGGRLRDVNALRRIDPERSVLEFEKRFAETVAAISSSGAVIALFTEPPRQLEDPVLAEIRRMVTGQQKVTLAVSRAEHESRISLVYGIMGRAGAGKLYRIDYTDHFCEGSLCASLADGDSLYHDVSHLSAYGARSIVPLLKSDLQRLRKYSDSTRNFSVPWTVP